MNKAERALLILAIVITVALFVDTLGDILVPHSYWGWNPSEDKGVLPRIILYSVAGVLSLAVGVFLRRVRRLLGTSLAIGGVHLLLCACNGGIFTTSFPKVRLAVTGATLIILIMLAVAGQPPAEEGRS
ncbi:MAG: hypothetical protein WCS70_12990 [Verrucomicrobiota bacterium]|jgi:hypothetical protein